MTFLSVVKIKLHKLLMYLVILSRAKASYKSHRIFAHSYFLVFVTIMRGHYTPPLVFLCIWHPPVKDSFLLSPLVRAKWYLRWFWMGFAVVLAVICIFHENCECSTVGTPPWHAALLFSSHLLLIDLVLLFSFAGHALFTCSAFGNISVGSLLDLSVTLHWRRSVERIHVFGK